MADYYCPTCQNKLERVAACGSESYFCDTCKGLVSRSSMLSEEDVAEAKAAKSEEGQ